MLSVTNSGEGEFWSGRVDLDAASGAVANTVIVVDPSAAKNSLSSSLL